MSVSFLLSKADSDLLKERAGGAHGGISTIVRAAVMATETVSAQEIAFDMPAGPYTEKFNVVEGIWSDRARRIADELTAQGVDATQGTVIRFLVHRALKDQVEAEPA